MAAGALAGGLLGAGKDTSGKTSTSTSTSTSNPYQQGQFDTLLGGADAWLNSGGFGNQPNYTSQMGNTLQQMGDHYQGLLSGKGTADRYATLQDLNKASSEQASNALGGELNKIGMGMGAQGVGNSSRAGIAQGVATGAANRDLASLQAQQNQDFLLNEQKLKEAGATGMSGLFGQIGQLQANAQANTPEAQRLQALLAYQQMIAGNMGGTTTTTGTSTGPAGSQLGNIIGGAATGAGLFGS